MHDSLVTGNLMVRAVEQIEQNLAKLEEVNTLLASEVHETYSKYLALLGQAVRQQLIMATYRVCTQGYPDSFLNLSFNQRQQLQIGLKQLGGQAIAKLISHLDPSDDIDQEEEQDESGETEESEETNLKIDTQLLEIEEESSEATPTPVAVEMPSPEDEPEAAEDTSTLEQLAQWQKKVEQAIDRTLQTTSTSTNTLLQEAGIIPKKLPTAVFEAAAKVETSSDTTAGPPNLMNLLMEIESNEEDEDSSVTRIIAVNLRLPEIEFADPSLSVARNQIHQLLAKAKTLRQKYRKKQRELAVAKAEAAWRACWFEE